MRWLIYEVYSLIWHTYRIYCIFGGGYNLVICQIT